MKMTYVEEDSREQKRENYIGIIVANWQRLIRAIGDKDWMPCAQDNGSGLYIHEYYGCGGYGCVFPTNQKGIVFKLTNDPHEAKFVEYILTNNIKLDGIVKYHKIVKLPIRVDGNPVCAIWREEAYSVGRFDGANFFENSIEDLYRASNWLYNHIALDDNYYKSFKAAESYALWAATNVTRGLTNDFKNVTGPKKLAILTQYYELEAKNLADSGYGYEIGETLLKLRKDGILLLDVKIDNVGVAIRHNPKQYVPVIIDPSLAIFMAPK